MAPRVVPPWMSLALWIQGQAAQSTQFGAGPAPILWASSSTASTQKKVAYCWLLSRLPGRVRGTCFPDGSADLTLGINQVPSPARHSRPPSSGAPASRRLGHCVLFPEVTGLACDADALPWLRVGSWVS